MEKKKEKKKEKKIYLILFLRKFSGVTPLCKIRKIFITLHKGDV